ncbi:MAG: flagellar basal body rod C-terminal domain-containing protein, partial [Planctomycetota bacterium]
DDGNPIVIGRDTPATNLRIDTAGVLRDSITGEQIAKLAVVQTPADVPNAVRPVGGNLYATDTELTPTDGNTQVLGGFVERSNVDPTTELTRMMEATRFLEANAQMIRHQDTAYGKLIDAAKLG